MHTNIITNSSNKLYSNNYNIKVTETVTNINRTGELYFIVVLPILEPIGNNSVPLQWFIISLLHVLCIICNEMEVTYDLLVVDLLFKNILTWIWLLSKHNCITLILQMDYLLKR